MIIPSGLIATSLRITNRNYRDVSACRLHRPEGAVARPLPARGTHNQEAQNPLNGHSTPSSSSILQCKGDFWLLNRLWEVLPLLEAAKNMAHPVMAECRHSQTSE